MLSFSAEWRMRLLKLCRVVWRAGDNEGNNNRNGMRGEEEGEAEKAFL